MYKIIISQRYQKLFTCSVVKKGLVIESIVFPQFNIPLIFRTDASARHIGYLVREHLNNERSLSDHCLQVNNECICCSSLSVIYEIVAVWKKQKINIGKLSVVASVDSNCATTEATRENILKNIYSQCTK